MEVSHIFGETSISKVIALTVQKQEVPLREPLVLLLFVLRDKELQIRLESNDQILVLAETCTTWDKVTTDYILLEVCQWVALALDCSLVQDLGSLLERCSRDEARSLQSCAGDTLEYLVRSSRHNWTSLNQLHIAALQR